MKRAIFVLLLLASPAFAEDQPDVSGILHLVGRFSSAHACPVAAGLAFTSAHVVDPRPFEADVALVPFRYSTDAGGEGILTPESSRGGEDLATASLTPPVTRFYPIADRPPGFAENVWFIGYDFRGQRDAFATRVFRTRVLRVVAGLVVLKDEPPEGSSGSCVLNAKGEVVAIIDFGLGLADGRAIGGAVGVWGRWNPLKKEDRP